MPPKGWRKDAQGNYPSTSYMKEQENVTIEDLLFPRSVITSLAKEVVQLGQTDSEVEKRLVINKDAAIALQRSATIFVNHLLLFAREIAREQNRRSCNVDDILASVEYIGLPGLRNIIMDKMSDYQEAQRILTAQRQQQKTTDEDKDSNDKEQEEEEIEEGDTPTKKLKTVESQQDEPNTTTNTESEIATETEQSREPTSTVEPSI
ncbi:similar to Saccharomyces cerevisiae YDR121W DPB4 Shared subunit of DNA polymerase (II) epsilon and of ISW2/yCHRAC chromatin accessibility complex [Maudiozyma saulgeensis]|uniref:DNA polymerase epsilon subunit D n=1 Tax=Maudiozyma saulgeensis TaxID=1789683 RepID=A0A1X7R649_9SACH|nr:similar to Saccharomyces cerevisiae YDR121W DPB4 Shared subunit of DNA polymerase (II) epsilon and of ISW2/yCHRAC chromatin accessibility complex [Kazachstania saulgeensis]